MYVYTYIHTYIYIHMYVRENLFNDTYFIKAGFAVINKSFKLFNFDAYSSNTQQDSHN